MKLKWLKAALAVIVTSLTIGMSGSTGLGGRGRSNW